jgi:uncharacterized membrane protein HdeD (DUF308 family)
MKQHPFDPFALVLGALTAVAGIVMFGDPNVGDVPGWLLPMAILAVGGVLILASLLRRNSEPHELVTEGMPAPADEPL